MDPLEENFKPEVIIYDDQEALNVKQLVWGLLSGRDFTLTAIDDLKELEDRADDAVLIFMAADPDASEQFKNICDLAENISTNPKVSASLLAVGKVYNTDVRLKLLGCGFESAFNLEMLETPQFRPALIKKYDRAIMRMERNKAQEEYALFKAAMASSPDAIMIFDEDNKIFFASDHYMRAYPVNGDKLYKGMDVLDAFDQLALEQGVHKDMPEYEHMRIFWETLEGQVEFKLNNDNIWRITAKQLPGDVGAIVTTTDITTYRNQQMELTQKSEALKDALQKEKEASNLQKQFINMVSHEFRTPLSIIDGNAQILRRRGMEIGAEGLEKRTRIIRSAVSRLVHMMEDILSSNTLKTGRFELNRENIPLAKIVRDLCDEFSDLSSLHIIDYELKNVPEMAILDKKVLTLTQSNLLSNAVRYSDDDTTIKVRAWTEGKEFCLSVSDEGYGIPDHEKESIFEPYYRGESSSNIAGTGIGLNLVKRLIEMHNGSIDLESQVGVGTTFTIRIPFDKSEDEDEVVTISS